MLKRCVTDRVCRYVALISTHPVSSDNAVTLYVLVDAFHVPATLSDFATEKAQSSVISTEPYVTIALVVALDGKVLYVPE